MEKWRDDHLLPTKLQREGQQEFNCEGNSGFYRKWVKKKSWRDILKDGMFQPSRRGGMWLLVTAQGKLHSTTTK